MNFSRWGLLGLGLLSFSCSSGQTGSPSCGGNLSCQCQQLVGQDLAQATVLSIGQKTSAKGEVVNTGVFEIEAIIVPSPIFDDHDLHRKISGVFSTKLACDPKAQPIPNVGDSVLLSFSDYSYKSELCSVAADSCVQQNCRADAGDLSDCLSRCEAQCPTDRSSDTISIDSQVQPFADALALGQGQSLPFPVVATLTGTLECQPAYPSPTPLRCADTGRL